MRKLILALVLATAAVANVQAASTTTIRANPTTSVFGQAVTFTASFTTNCAGALAIHYFTIDGKNYNGTLAQSGQAGTETLSISTLTVGSHSLSYYWKNPPFCQGIAYLTYTVAAVQSPSPSPPPPPSPSPIPSPTAVTLVANKPSDSPLLGYLGGALILVTVVAGVGLAILGRR